MRSAELPQARDRWPRRWRRSSCVASSSSPYPSATLAVTVSPSKAEQPTRHRGEGHQMAGTNDPEHRAPDALLAAVVAVASDLDLQQVLQRIVESAAVLTDARYGALGVLS